VHPGGWIFLISSNGAASLGAVPKQKKAIPSPAKAMDNIMQQCSHSASEYKYKGIIYFPSLTSSAKEELFHPVHQYERLGNRT
jgi:hypothetical protein